MTTAQRTPSALTHGVGALPAKLAFASSGAAVLSLIALHVVSSEFDPSWRMVSEYALGDASWLLSVMFLCWALGSWTLAMVLWPRVTGLLAKVGLVFLLLAGFGECMAAFFDVSHPLHGLAALIGVPSVPIAAALISFGADKRALFGQSRAPLSLTAHLTWLAFAAMTVAMILLMTTFQQAGGDMSSGGVPATLPEGTIAVNGWANRFLVLADCAWVMIAARQWLLADKIES